MNKPEREFAYVGKDYFSYGYNVSVPCHHIRDNWGNCWRVFSRKSVKGITPRKGVWLKGEVKGGDEYVSIPHTKGELRKKIILAGWPFIVE